MLEQPWDELGYHEGRRVLHDGRSVLLLLQLLVERGGGTGPPTFCRKRARTEWTEAWENCDTAVNGPSAVNIVKRGGPGLPTSNRYY
jgi:hypothetical protein